jgi:hypothetical protein
MAQPLFQNPKKSCRIGSIARLSPCRGFKMADKKKHKIITHLMYLWCTSKVCSSLSLCHSFIFTPGTDTVPEHIQVPIHQASSDQRSWSPSARCWGWGKGSELQNFIYFQKNRSGFGEVDSAGTFLGITNTFDTKQCKQLDQFLQIWT